MNKRVGHIAQCPLYLVRQRCVAMVRDKLLKYIKDGLGDQEDGSGVLTFAGVQGLSFVGRSEIKRNDV
jgi:hypothetical protein